MTVPSRQEAASLLLSLDPPAWQLRHSRAVAEVAAFLAGRAARRGFRVDVALVEAAALLHDVDKTPGLDRVDGHLPHGERGASWLARNGLDELSEPVRWHPVGRLVERGWERLLAPDPDADVELRVVAYADKRAGQRLESLGSRFAGWRRRYPVGQDGWDDARASIALDRARRLEALVCGWAGVEPEEVRRLRWTVGAIERAQARGVRAA